MFAVFPMKVRETTEWDAPDLPEILKAAADRSEKNVAQICREASISTAFWYSVVNKKQSSIKMATLKALCSVLGLSLNDVGLTD